MAQILREQGAYAALAAIKDAVAHTVPLWDREPSDPWLGTADTMLLRVVPSWVR